MRIVISFQILKKAFVSLGTMVRDVVAAPAWRTRRVPGRQPGGGRGRGGVACAPRTPETVTSSVLIP